MGSPDALDFDAAIYQDQGCPDLGIPSCLTCPLPRCRYDMGPKVARSYLRALEMLEILRTGATTDETADALGVSRRTILRLKKAIREEGLGDGYSRNSDGSD